MLPHDVRNADLKSSTRGADDQNVEKRLHLISLLPKSRANRVLNNWSHPASIMLRARQHASDLLSGVVSQSSSSSRNSKSTAATNAAVSSKLAKAKNLHNSAETMGSPSHLRNSTPLETFFQLLTAKGKQAQNTECRLSCSIV